MRVVVATQHIPVEELLSVGGSSVIASIPGAFAAVDMRTGNRTGSISRTPDCSSPKHPLLVGMTVYWLAVSPARSGLCAAAFGDAPRHVHSAIIGNFAIIADHAFIATAHEIERVPIGGGASTVVESVSDAEPAFTTSSRFVFWSTGGAIHYAPPSGGPVRAIGANLRPRSMVADDSNVYVATGSAIVRIGLATGATTVLVSHGADGLVLDGPRLYWFRTTAGDIGKVATFGGPPVTLASSFAPTSIAITPTSVFFVQGDDDQTLREISPK